MPFQTAMAPAEDAGAPFRLVARADLGALIGVFEPRPEPPQRRARGNPLTATALILDPAGETLHVACAGDEVCVAHCRIAQGTTASGDVRPRFVVDDVTRSPDAHATASRGQSSSSAPSTSEVVGQTIHELCSVPARRCVAARAAAGVTVHYYGRAGVRVFAIPGTANASAISADHAGSHPTRIAVACPEGKKRVVVYEVPARASATSPQNTENTENTESVSSAVLIFDIAAEIILGVAHPARAMTWVGARLAVATPKGVVSVRLADGLAKPFPKAFGSERGGTSGWESMSRRAALAKLAPRRPPEDGVSYDTMFGAAPIGIDRKDTPREGDTCELEPSEPPEPAEPALCVTFEASSGAANGILALAPERILLRVRLGGDRADSDADSDLDADSDSDSDLDTGSGSAERADRRTDVSWTLATEVSMAPPVAVTHAFPYAVLVSKSTNRARVVYAERLAPRDAPERQAGFGDSTDDRRDWKRRTSDFPFLVSGAPRGAVLGRGDHLQNDLGMHGTPPFSCPSSASSLVAARGGSLELYRARSTRERAVALAVAGRLEEAVSLADARGDEVEFSSRSVPNAASSGDAASGPASGPVSGPVPGPGPVPVPFNAFAVATRAECGFLAVARLEFEYAAKLWESVGNEIRVEELLPYFPRLSGSAAAPSSFVSRLGARERAAVLGIAAPRVSDLETVIASHPSRPSPRAVARLSLRAKRAFVGLLRLRTVSLGAGDPPRRGLDTLTLCLWAETANAGALEDALDGTERARTGYDRDVDVSVLTAVLRSSGRHFARALAHWRLERNEDAALETYAALASGELVEAPSEPKGGAAYEAFEDDASAFEDDASAFEDEDEDAADAAAVVIQKRKRKNRIARAAARLATDVFRERCREDCRGPSRPTDAAVKRWTRKHARWILEAHPEKGVSLLALRRVARAVDPRFVLETTAAAKVSRAVAARLLRDRIEPPFAPDRTDEDAHTAFAIASWEASEEAEVPFPDVLARFLRSDAEKKIRVDARQILAAMDPNAATSSSARGTLALGLVAGVRVAPPEIPARLRKYARALAELRAAVGDHVAAYRLLNEIAGDTAAAEALVARFGVDAERARDAALAIQNRENRGGRGGALREQNPQFSRRGKF